MRVRLLIDVEVTEPVEEIGALATEQPMVIIIIDGDRQRYGRLMGAITE